ncbi:MAG: SHOCT domain-containing protein [Chloroflexota bacterium]
MRPPGALPPPRLRSVLLLAAGVAGLAMCITLVYLGMRAVMDIGGACADGGPYVSARPCPDGVPGAMLLGGFGLFLFGGLAMVGASGTGGYAWVPLIAWTGLFASLGWNFLDYGLVNAPEGQGIAWGYVIPGVLFQVMAWVPVVVLVAGMRQARRWRSASDARPLRGPGMPPRGAVPGVDRPPPVPDAHRVEHAGSARQVQLQAIDGAMGALVLDATAHAPVGPVSDHGAAFAEDTQALLDRLERLGQMRDRGLLAPDEYETAKEAVMHELEARS